jgi:hypothetical protein
MDSIRVSEAPDTGSIPVEATLLPKRQFCKELSFLLPFEEFDNKAIS